MPGALDGIRILDLTSGIAGPLGVLMLAEQGADVIKVEPPGGDPGRSQPGATVWHRSRRSIELDLSDDEDKQQFLRLVASADVLVESAGPGEMEKLGLAYADLCARHRGLVFCSIRPYPPGHRAEHRGGHDALIQARAGIQFEQPGWRPGPIHLHLPAPSMATAFLTASAVLAALISRERTGRGQHVSTSLYQGALAFTTQIWQEHEHGEPGLRNVMAKTYPPGIHQPTIFECADREWIHAATMSGRTPTATVEEILGLEPVDQMVLYGDPAAAAAHRELLRDAFRSRGRDEIVEALHAAGLGAEAIVPMEDAYDHPQLVANDMVASIDDPDLGPTTQIGVPIHLSATPGAIQGPQPLLDGDRAEILAELDEWEPTASRHRAAGNGPDGAGPLAGIRVLDLGQFLAGPFGPMILADLGADVVKVEPVRGDSMRMVAMPFAGCQRGKRGLAVDLKSEAGRSVVNRLVERADIVHHNMTKGTATRLGIDADTLRQFNPELVYCNTYAYGPVGPMSDFGGLDPLYQASCGLEYEAGATAEGNSPLYIRLGMTDTANAFVSVVGVLAALLHRERTGESQDVWTSLLDAAAVLSSDEFLLDNGDGPRRPRLDAGLTGPSPDLRLYETQAGWVQVAAPGDDEWRALCTVVGLPELIDDPRCAGPDDRVTHREEIGALLEEAFRQRTATGWVHLFDAAGVPAEVAVDTNDGELVLHDGDNERLGLVVSSSHPLLGEIRQFGSLFSFSDTPVDPGGAPPMLGQHTREVLAEAGFTGDEVDALLAEGAISEPGDDYGWSI